MKNRLRVLYKWIVGTAMGVCVLGFASSEAVFAADDKVPASQTQRIQKLDDMDFIEMLNSVDVGSTSALIQKFQTKEGKTRLLNGKYNPKGSALLRRSGIRRFFLSPSLRICCSALTLLI